jgi:transposase
VNGVRRQLGTGWRTVWEAIKPLLENAADQEARFEGVTVLGVDEHVWHHVSTKPIEDGGRGPKELTGMVDLSPASGRCPHRQADKNGNLVVRARLLDLVPGRSGKAYADWLTERGQGFRAGVQVATLDPFHGYKNAIEDQLDDARAVLDAFHARLARHRRPSLHRSVAQLVLIVFVAIAAGSGEGLTSRFGHRGAATAPRSSS